MESRDENDAFERLGGEAGITRWIARFYELIAEHALLAPLFTQDLNLSRDKQAAFMIEFFGGPPLYSERHGKAFLRFKHRHIRIGRPERDAWMALILKALNETGVEEPLASEVEERLATLATAMINHDPEKEDSYFFN